jgi:hypothetical protein
MSHLAARQAIAAILAGQGAGLRALGLVTALRLSDHGPGALAEAAMAAAQAMPADRGPLRPHPANQEAVPSSGDACWTALAERCTEHPAHLGHALAVAAGLARLWSSATQDERPLLRTRYLAGLVHTTAPLGSYATRDQLRAATRDLPTSADDGPFTAAALVDLPHVTQASDAHRLVAGLLTDAERLVPVAAAVATIACRAVGAGSRSHLAEDAVLAALHLRHHSALAPETQALLILQAAHQTWWATSGARPSEEVAADSRLDAAITASKVASARRAGRRAAADGRFWAEIQPLALELLTRGTPGWVHPIALLAEVPGDHQPPPDLAAAIAAGFARAWAVA